MLVGALPPALISLLLVASRVSAAPYDFLDNYRDPTPAADEGPPASYQAVRDKNVLPYEICGVVGGYVFTVLIWGVLLLTVGRKMRRKALDPPKQLELELQDKPTLPALRTAGLTSPPLSARSFFGKFKRNRNDSAVSNPQSPVVQSPSSFDQKVVDAHRGQDQADMERLYAAVMDFDERKHSSKVSVEETEPIPRPTERRRPSNISIARPESHSETPISPVKAIYPPNYSVQQPAAPTHGTHLRADAHPPPSPRSILSKRSQNSNTNSTGSKNARFNLKNLRISGPIAKYPGADSDDEARTPLSPRFYANPGVPPSPPTQTNSPTSPEQYTEEALDSVQPLPRPAPQRLGLGPPPTSTSQPPSTTTTRQHPPKPLTSPPTSLPLRSFASPLASPGIQTTVLDRRVEALALGTPKTGVPFTPYSPYMPFTPITPVTPHLTTRKERKMEKKEGRKYGSRKPRVEEELVQSPKEIFGDGW